MRLFQLCFLLFLCTCVRAQMIVDKTAVLGTKADGRAYQTAAIADGSIAVLRKASAGYRIFNYPELGGAAATDFSIDVAQRATTLHLAGTVEGGYLVGWSGKRKKGPVSLSWYTAGKSEAIGTVELASKQVRILGTEQERGGVQSVLYTDEVGTYLSHYVLRRRDLAYSPPDTVAAAVRIERIKEVQITNRNIISYCRVPGGDYMGLSLTEDGGAVLTRFGAGGAQVDKEIPFRPRMDVPKFVRYLPLSGGYLVAGEHEEDKIALYEVNANGLGNAGNPYVDNVGLDFSLTALGVLPDNTIFTTGSYRVSGNDYNNRSSWEGVFQDNSDRTFKPIATEEGKKYQEIELLLTKPEGLFWVVGFTFKKELIAAEGGHSAEVPPNLDYAFGRPILHDHQGDHVLDATERAALELPYAGEGGLAHLRAKLVFDAVPSGLTLPPTMISGQLLGGDTASIYFPLSANAGLPTGSFPYRIEVDYNGALVNTIRDTLQTRSAPAPLIVIDTSASGLTYRTKRTNKVFKRGDTLTGRVTVRNDGRDSALNVIISTLYVPHVEISEHVLNVGNLAPGDSVSATFTFTPRSYYEHSTLPLNFFVSDDSKRYLHTSFTQTLPNVFDIQEYGGPSLSPAYEEYRNQRGGPNAYEPMYFEGTEVELQIPCEEEGVITSLYHTPIQFIISNPFPLTNESITIVNADTKVPADFCFREDLIPIEKDSKSLSDPKNHRYIFQGELNVERGKKTDYIIRIGDVKTGKNFTVDAAKRQVINELHIYAAGITNLSGVASHKMAAMVSAAFANSNKTLFFDNVELHKIKLNSAGEVDFSSIGTLIDSVKTHKINNGIPVMPYCVIYIAAHGIDKTNDVLILDKKKRHTLSLIEDIIQPLIHVPAHKMFIVDACFSAGAKVGFENLLTREEIDKAFSISLLMSAVNLSKGIKNSWATHFSNALIKVLGSANDVAVIPAANTADGMFTSGELYRLTESVTKQSLLKDSISGIGSSIFYPQYTKSKNTGYPSFQDYFYEVTLSNRAINECAIQQ